MSDKDLIAMIVNKIDDLNGNMNSKFDKVDDRFDKVDERLDKHEAKMDVQSEKLNEFEVKANSVLAAHETDIVNLKSDVARIKDKESKGSDNPIVKFISSEWFFKIIVFLLLTFGVVNKDSAKTALDMFTGSVGSSAKTEEVKK